MATKERIFFAGAATTFAILAIGFGGGLLMANSTLRDEAVQRRGIIEPPRAARVIYPPSREPALQVTAAAPEAAPAEPSQPAQVVQALPQVSPAIQAEREKQAEKQAERAARRKAESAARERRKRLAEMKARREAYARRQQESRPLEPRIMAFDVGDERPRVSGFFGN
jgi:type IV secretory pathway VirB10-like protein